jgi:integrase
MDRGIFFDRDEAERMTVADLVDRFVIEFAPHHYRKRADEKEAWRFQCARLRDMLGGYSLAALDQKLVAGFRDARLREVGDSTVRKELYMLSKVLGFAETECGITLPRGNPVLKVRRPVEGRSRERRLNADEWARFETECRASRNSLLWLAVEFAIETAMRQGEILGLLWRDVDFKRKFVMIRETKNGEDRAVPLSGRALAILQALKAGVISIDGRAFPLVRIALYRVFHYAAVRAKIEDYTFHDLRHEALSRLAERGDMSMLDLAAFSGHKTLQMLKRYTHLNAERLAERLSK